MTQSPGSKHQADAALESAAPAARQMHRRAIPSSGEQLPVVGCGTYVGFDVAPNSAAYRELPGVLQALFEADGSVLDSSPMYGRAETTLG